MPPIEYYSPVSGGAVATVTASVAEELELLNHEVYVLSPEDAQPVYPAGRVHPVHFEPTGLVGRIRAHAEARLRRWDHLGEGRFWRETTRILMEVRPDVVVLANDILGARRVKQVLPKVTVVGWLHNECEPRGDIDAGIKAADVFLACSDYIKEWFLSRYKPTARIYTAHAGVDGSTFFPDANKAGETLRCIYVGRLDPNKGVDVAVQAVADLRQRKLDVSITVAGSAWFYNRPDKSSCKYISGLKQEMKRAHADWLGHVPRRWLPGVLREHDVALVLSRSREPFGLVVLEAMASGLVVVASPHGGLSEACGGAGIFADPENKSGLQQKLEKLCKDRAELWKWRQCSMQRAMQARWATTASVLLKAVQQGAGARLGR